MSGAGVLVELAVLGKVALAAVVGGIIGVDRELAGKPAGLRTHMLVSASAAMFVVLAELMVEHFINTDAAQLIRSDPIRTIEAVVTGVAFLGAGTIVVARGDRKVEGLTTAASVLLASALGIAIVLGFYVLGVCLAVLTLVVLRGLGWLERLIHRRRR